MCVEDVVARVFLDITTATRMLYSLPMLSPKTSFSPEPSSPWTGLQELFEIFIVAVGQSTIM